MPASCNPLMAVCTVEVDSVVKKLLSLMSVPVLSSSLLAVSMEPFIRMGSPAEGVVAAVGAAMGAAETEVDADWDDMPKPAEVNDEDASDKKARLFRPC